MKAQYNKAILVGLLAAGIACTTGCRDYFAELNQDPGKVTIAEPSQLMAEAIRRFDPTEYTDWFYNAKMFGKWDGLHLSGAYTADFYEMTPTGKQGTHSPKTLKYRNEILRFMEDNETEKYKMYSSVCDILAIYCGLYDSDVYGSIPYSEASQYPYGPLTPKYDRLEDLYNLWLTTLDDCIKNFNDETIETIQPSQDAIYGGDTDNWARLANSLKLRIAVRLLKNDPAKAKSIAEAVVRAGYIDDTNYDFLLCKATTVNNDGDYVYHFGDAINNNGLVPNKEYVDFMVRSADPRVRFLYCPNAFNKGVIKGFIADGRYNDLPSYVKDQWGDEEASDWTGNETAARYSGYPAVWNGTDEYEALKGEYFTPATRYKLTVGSNSKTYNHVSYFNEELVRGRCNFTLPTLPGGPVVEDTDDIPWTGLFLGAAEVNLYLAEFKLLGANLPQSAEYYYNRGVRLSMDEYDQLGAVNKIPYYNISSISEEVKSQYGIVSIALQPGEVDAALATDGYRLTGTISDDMEKVYLQQMINFSLLPNEQFVTARRSGYPKVGSSLVSYPVFDGVNIQAVPRRFSVSIPLQTDVMKDIKDAAYQEQGLTPGSNQSGAAFIASGTVLNTERLWMDKNAPQWGAGTNL